MMSPYEHSQAELSVRALNDEFEQDVDSDAGQGKFTNNI